MEENCSLSTWNRPIEFFLSHSHSQHSSASIFWVFSLSNLLAVLLELYYLELSASVAVICKYLLLTARLTRFGWLASVYGLLFLNVFNVLTVLTGLLVLLRMRSPRPIYLSHQHSLVSALLVITSIASHTMRRKAWWDWHVEDRGCLDNWRRGPSLDLGSKFWNKENTCNGFWIFALAWEWEACSDLLSSYVCCPSLCLW